MTELAIELNSENSEKIRLRCPSCAKLYEVKSADIRESSPQFQCVACQCRFTFDFPVPAGEMALARAVDAESQDRECRKCGALNKAQSQECYNCQVLFSKVEDLPLDPTLRAQPSLVRKWKLLLQNFDDISQHEAFLMNCHQLDALRFATLKYEEIRIEHGRSAICDQMLRRIRAMSEVALMNRPADRGDEAKKVSAWSRMLIWSPYVLSLGLIVWGSAGLAHRNMVGVGVAIACLATGLILIVRGKLSRHDFMG